MATLKTVLIIIEVLLIFNLLIAVHELGHFLAAKWRGLKIDRFAIWFGKPIWQKEINGVVYCLGSIPAGGYVALPQMAAMEAIEVGPAAAQSRVPRWDARGLGPLPWQGIACLDATEDGRVVPDAGVVENVQRGDDVITLGRKADVVQVPQDDAGQ